MKRTKREADIDHEPPADHTEDAPDFTEPARPFLSGRGYRRLRRNVVLATTLVAVVPLIIMTVINYVQYEHSLRTEMEQTIGRLLANNKQSLEDFLAERQSALSYLVRERSFADLCDSAVLRKIISSMNESFYQNLFVDLGLIDERGNQLSYAGPYRLEGGNFSNQDWFHHVVKQRTYISGVFLGHRNSPHFAIATRHAGVEGNRYILRATFDAEMLRTQIHVVGLGLYDDVFLINEEGVLQTSSRRFGRVLDTMPLDVPPASPHVELTRHRDANGRDVILGYTSITDSPFLLMYVQSARGAPDDMPEAIRLFGFLALSIALVVAVILWGSGQFVRHIRAENVHRATLMHKVEYSNKLASLGRMAAGVAHEINNPLAIIDQKAGLLKDIVSLKDKSDNREKYLDLVDSVLRAMARCKTITHRLLGFAKHMDVQHEVIKIPELIREVLEFLGKEAEYRNIQLRVNAEDDLPKVQSDRGRLQQVFLNLFNNAVSAVKDGGHIDITAKRHEDGWVSVTVADDGIGIPEENLSRIFEPFFTTKEGSGTGLGLSITYGIVEKLGGRISVESEIGRGSRFTVLLPTQRES